jgi:uncharacterized protein with PhoU and TrkA domain
MLILLSRRTVESPEPLSNIIRIRFAKDVETIVSAAGEVVLWLEEVAAELLRLFLRETQEELVAGRCRARWFEIVSERARALEQRGRGKGGTCAPP